MSSRDDTFPIERLTGTLRNPLRLIQLRRSERGPVGTRTRLLRIAVIGASVTATALALFAVSNAVDASASVSFVSPAEGSALNNTATIASSSTSCALSAPNGPFSFAPGFTGSAEPSSSLSLPDAPAQYFYVGASDGSSPQTSSSWLQDLSVPATNTQNTSVSIGESTSNEGSFSVGGNSNVAVAGIGISNYSVVQSFSATGGTPSPDAESSNTASLAGASLNLSYYVPSSGDVVVILVGGQGTGLVGTDESALSTLVDDTYSECGSNVLASVAIFAGSPGTGRFHADFSSTSFYTNNGTTLGAEAYVLQPSSVSSPTRPSAPFNVAATAMSKTVGVSWLAPQSVGGSVVTHYTVTAEPGGETCRDEVPQTQSCTVRGLKNGVAYSFSVTASNAVGTGPPSAAIEDIVPRAGQDPKTIFDDQFSGRALSSAWLLARGSNESSTNDEEECYSPKNVSVKGDALRELAEVGSSCGADCPQWSNVICPYTSGGVQWSHLAFTYGTVTVRAKFSGGSGTWPAIWLLGSQCQHPSWLDANCNWPAPGANEIDIAEDLYSNHSRINEQIHTQVNGGSIFQPDCEAPVSEVNEKWHTYTLVWAPGSLTWYVDGAQTCQMTTSIPSTPMFLIINTAVGGIGAGTVRNSTLPQTTEIAYVRVTQP